MKTKFMYLLVMISIPICLKAQNKVLQLSGKVLQSVTKEPLPGASVRIKNTNIGTISSSDGSFNITSLKSDGILIITFVGYLPREIPFTVDQSKGITAEMERNQNQMAEVMVSTGYQLLPKERATGSFVQIDNDLINRRVSTDILSRLEDVTSGLQFNKGVTSNNASTKISIRGQSTINANVDPLIVVDNFPYDGNLNNINPNDVESITVLKDAAAASIWGARAGNGVIVITTKKGAYNKPIQVSFNSNVTIGNKPDPFYASQMSVGDFIDVEKSLFTQGFYASSEQAYGSPPLTPVIELLIAKRDGLISAEQVDAQIDALTRQDVRKDIHKYLYRESINQQYALSLNGGAPNQRYFISAGYDKNLDNLVRNGYDRVTVNGNNTWSFFKKHLEIGAGFNFTQSKTQQNNMGLSALTFGPYGNPIYPYAQLADNDGNALGVTKDLRQSFVSSAPQNGLLDWEYRPLDEVRLANNQTTISDTRLLTNITYKIIKGLNASVLYQYQKSLANGHNLQSQQTYFARNLINTFSYLDPNGMMAYNLPKGGILDRSASDLYSHNFRAQFSYDNNWGKHSFSGIGGYEIKAIHTLGDTYRLYGYDDEHATSKPVDYISQFDQYQFPGSFTQIPDIAAQSGLTDNFRSYFANGAYTYDGKYILSGSARIDQSNLFGVKTNQKGVPLWSTGIAWNLSRENFYGIGWLPLLKLRATYGYNGNVAKNLSAYTTATYGFTGAPDTGLPYATIQNPPNPLLRWERIRTINLGVDFSTKNEVIEGTLEYYHKNGLDLIGTIPFAPSTGISTFTGNSANTEAHGVDLSLHSRNIDGLFKWSTNFLLSYQTDKVTSYAMPNSVSTYIGTIGYPIVGKPLYAVYSYRWAGLDPQTGDPQGYLDNGISKDYSAIINSSKPEDIVFNGSARPKIFGSFRNTFSWKDFSVSASITYRFNYYFRKSSVNYNTVLNGLGGNGDYALRWQQPGDEKLTNVPSLPAAIDQNRDTFYLTSQALVGKADNIRLQDVTVSYDFSRLNWKKLPFAHVQLYAYGNNLVMIWKANHFGIDPDYQTGPPPRTFALGLKVDF